MMQQCGDSINSDYRLLNKQEFAGLLGCTTRTVDRMVASEQVPLSIIVRIPSGVKGNTKTRLIYGRTVAWIKSLAGPMKQNAEAN